MASLLFKYITILAFIVLQLTLSTALPSDTFNQLETKVIPIEKRTTQSGLLWDAAEIPYSLDGIPDDISYLMRNAMRQWEQSSCIRFVPKTTQPAWLTIKMSGVDCWTSTVGSTGAGEIVIGLDPSCMSPNTAIHELGHAIGLIHEHQRADRDQFIRVLWDNIQDGQQVQFDLYKATDTHVPFDYNSVMLYKADALAKDNMPTLQSTTDQQINPWDSPTANNFKAVNDAYKCEEEYTRVIPQCLSGTIPANGDYSTYSFTLDKHTEAYLNDNGYTHIAVHQNCLSNAIDMDTDNWGFMPINSWGSNSQYTVTTDRCKKDHNRHVNYYEVALCKGDYEEACDMGCGPRSVCPVDDNNNQIDSKAIDVMDPVLWICNPH